VTRPEVERARGMSASASDVDASGPTGWAGGGDVDACEKVAMKGRGFRPSAGASRSARAATLSSHIWRAPISGGSVSLSGYNRQRVFAYSEAGVGGVWYALEGPVPERGVTPTVGHAGAKPSLRSTGCTLSSTGVVSSSDETESMSMSASCKSSSCRATPSFAATTRGARIFSSTARGICAGVDGALGWDGCRRAVRVGRGGGGATGCHRGVFYS
jgi:hypothetical protein